MGTIESDLGRPLARLRIVAGALIAGPLAFFAVALAIGPLEREADLGGEPLISYLAAFTGVLALAMRVFLTGAIERDGRRKIAEGRYQPGAAAQGSELVAEHGDAARLFALYQARTIIGAALLEGVAFFAGIGYLLEGTTLSLATGAAFVALQVATFPTEGRGLEWIRNQAALLDAERR